MGSTYNVFKATDISALKRKDKRRRSPRLSECIFPAHTHPIPEPSPPTQTCTVLPVSKHVAENETKASATIL